MVDGKGNSGLHYHLYLIAGDVDLNDAIAFAYCNSIQCEVRNKRKVLWRDLDPLYMPDENDRADDNLFRKTIVVEMLGDGDKICAMVV